MSHPDDCSCINCNPTACTDCGMASPGGTHLNERGICRHSRACTARQMLKAGTPVEEAAAHAQGRELTLTKGEFGSGESRFDDVFLEQANSLAIDEDWPYDDDPPDPL